MNRAVRPSCWILLAILATAVLAARAQDATLTISNESPSVADRVTLDVSFTVAPGWTVNDWQSAARSALESAGWTVVAVERDAPVSVAAEAPIRHAGRILIEPFLAGEYEVPAIGTTASDAAGSTREISTVARTITVASLLPADEPVQPLVPVAAQSELGFADTPLGEFRAVPDAPPGLGPVPALVGAAIALLVAVVAMAVAWRCLRASGDPTPVDPVRTLRRLAKGGSPDLGEVDRCVRALAHHPGIHAAHEHRDRIDALIADLERARYAPRAGGPSATPSELAAEGATLAREISLSVPADAGVPVREGAVA